MDKVLTLDRFTEIGSRTAAARAQGGKECRVNLYRMQRFSLEWLRWTVVTAAQQCDVLTTSILYGGNGNVYVLCALP